MKALIVDSGAPFGLRLANVPDPVPGPGQVLMDVACTSLNFGELSMARSGHAPAGRVLGWDAAGTVAAQGPDHSGPELGTPIVARGADGGWAERRAVDVTELAEVPAGVDLAEAAALPVAAGTALQALRAAGPILGRRVLITGASGGVGRFAVQLAALGGAHVIASVGSREHGEGLEQLGAHEVVIGPEGVDHPVDIVLETVGGPQLVQSFALVVPGGNLQSIGWTSGEPAVFPPYSTVGPAKQLVSFRMTAGLARDLQTLLQFVASKRLKVEIGWRGPWQKVGEAAEALFGRRIKGKAVLDVRRSA